MTITREGLSGCICIPPPIVITDQELGQALIGMKKALSNGNGSLPAHGQVALILALIDMERMFQYRPV